MESISTESRVILALQALENNPSLTTRRAAEIYNAHVQHSVIDALADNHDAIFNPNLESSLI